MQDDFVVENDADKATLFADQLVTQCRLLIFADAEHQLEPITLAEIVMIISACRDERCLAPTVSPM
jgi:ABC-type branched-subunit amino acid transport system ATPase component